MRTANPNSQTAKHKLNSMTAKQTNATETNMNIDVISSDVIPTARKGCWTLTLSRS
jgi:hypothetical protein